MNDNKTVVCVCCMHACSVLSNSLRPLGPQPAGFLRPWNSLGKSTGVGCHFLLQRIFLTQGLNLHLLCLLHWQADSLSLSHLVSILSIEQLSYTGQLVKVSECGWSLVNTGLPGRPHRRDGPGLRSYSKVEWAEDQWSAGILEYSPIHPPPEHQPYESQDLCFVSFAQN